MGPCRTRPALSPLCLLPHSAPATDSSCPRAFARTCPLPEHPPCTLLPAHCADSSLRQTRFRLHRCLPGSATHGPPPGPALCHQLGSPWAPSVHKPEHKDSGVFGSVPPECLLYTVLGAVTQQRTEQKQMPPPRGHILRTRAGAAAWRLQARLKWTALKLPWPQGIPRSRPSHRPWATCPADFSRSASPASVSQQAGGKACPALRRHRRPRHRSPQGQGGRPGRDRAGVLPDAGLGPASPLGLPSSWSLYHSFHLPPPAPGPRPTCPGITFKASGSGLARLPPGLAAGLWVRVEASMASLAPGLAVSPEAWGWRRCPGTPGLPREATWGRSLLRATGRGSSQPRASRPGLL